MLTLTFPSECEYSITLTVRFYVGIENLHQMLSVIFMYILRETILIMTMMYGDSKLLWFIQ